MSCVPVNRAVDGRNARRAAFLALLFSTYMFEYMVTLTFIDQRNIAISGSSWQLALHYIDTLLSAAGKKFPILLPVAPGASQRQTNTSSLYPKCPERSMTYFTP